MIANVLSGPDEIIKIVYNMIFEEKQKQKWLSFVT